MKNRVFSLLVALCVTGVVCASNILAGDVYCRALTDSTAEVVSPVDKNLISVVIPSTVFNYRITNIGEGAFHECTSLSSITIPE